MKNSDVNFIFGLLNKKVVIMVIILEIILDLIYYIVPFQFTLFLTLPFTFKKALMVVGIFIVSKIFRVIGNYLITIIADNYLYKYENIQYDEYFKKLELLPIDVINEYQSGYLISVIEKVTTLVKELLSTEYLGTFLALSFFLYTTYTQSLSIFLIALFCILVWIIISFNIYKRYNNVIEDLYDEEYNYSSTYQDFVGNIKTIKSFDNISYFKNKIKKASDIKYRKNQEYVKLYATEELIRNTLIVIPFLIALVKAVVDLNKGIDTIGIITFYIALHVEMGFVFEELSKNIINWFELKAIRKKLNEIFKYNMKKKTIKDFETITLDKIRIKYKETAFKIEVDNLEINKKDKICITGKSGEGKTSILNLIMGNILDYDGNVYIDNKDSSNYKLDMGIVTQEIELFNMSIKENLCLGKNIDNKTLEKYLHELELDELIKFKNGLNTIVGEKGLKLSTGQKRRINILRSFLLDKDIYILDEPTSNLDTITEDIVVRFIIKNFKDKTLIITTHNEKIKEVCNKFYIVKNHKLKKLDSSLNND